MEFRHTRQDKETLPCSVAFSAHKMFVTLNTRKTLDLWKDAAAPRRVQAQAAPMSSSQPRQGAQAAPRSSSSTGKEPQVASAKELKLKPRRGVQTQAQAPRSSSCAKRAQAPTQELKLKPRHGAKQPRQESLCTDSIKLFFVFLQKRTNYTASL